MTKVATTTNNSASKTCLATLPYIDTTTKHEKFELGEGSKICVSKGGFKLGEAARKVELARKGLI
ncbi:unnamed protein product [Parascedosporium putredinis]|uniref:Uncharacterized protein n=1 Tax=Parascedosporium putredinis TaxID=1442378 RepID=A0A9P1GVC5_9PEZI|nr:unnamed protein product [Parascedosporium putredinis]CAI7988374.1 unnamed protein product [Parascedosporium putredinis]